VLVGERPPHDDPPATTSHSETAERLAREAPDRLPDAVVEQHRARATGANAAAFFDLDKTVIARSSVLAFGRELYRDGLLSTTTLLKGLYAQAVYQLVGADHEKMEQMRVALLELTRGWEAERVARIVRETLEQVIVPIVYAEALELFDEHRGAGRDLWLVSSSGEEIVRPLADHLGVPDIIATRARIDDEGRFDGSIEFYAYGKNKATAIEQVAQARGYDLERSYAYSDSITDLPMLGAVGHRIAVNPDRELRAAALAMGWEVRDFVKPVTLRSRLPSRPPMPVLVGLGVAAVAGAAAWALRRGSSDDAV
jgi:HAD superfamily hydrolase (TIGR01490 family)